jgi:hypothetical protein
VEEGGKVGMSAAWTAKGDLNEQKEPGELTCWTRNKCPRARRKLAKAKNNNSQTLRAAKELVRLNKHILVEKLKLTKKLSQDKGNTKEHGTEERENLDLQCTG